MSTKPKGVLYFWDWDGEHPHITGLLKVGKVYYELVGVRRSKIRTNFTGRKIPTKPQQPDLLEDE